MTQLLFGLWAIERPSYYITRTAIIMCADDGFGNLIQVSTFPSTSLE